METHEGRPRCFDTMVQNIILPQIALAQEQKNAKKGDNDVLETHVGRPRCFDPMIQNIILPKIALAQDQTKTPRRETTIFWKPMKGDHDVLIRWSKIL